MNPNGMTASLLNLLQALDSERHAMTLLIDAASVANDSQRLAAFKSLPENICALDGWAVIAPLLRNDG